MSSAGGLRLETMTEELKDKLRQTHDTMAKLREGTDSVRSSVYNTRYSRRVPWDEQ